jgi:hypothetical protein
VREPPLRDSGHAIARGDLTSLFGAARECRSGNGRWSW